jgi:hypothetical protein
MEVFIAPLSRGECHVRPVGIYDSLSHERSRAYRIYHARKKRTSRKGASCFVAASGSDTSAHADDDN